ncbi:hypothetical protein DPMN_068433 [Dreissena polymorpha]|uniref:Uncharacterized protein n=1 Tax=Dreissena polymorpha TaxID=45954 RepID=A0A9D3YXM2_DREPO|nr:hypothetical protein DPMN_068433 [Dreissena polymorpha]
MKCISTTNVQNNLLQYDGRRHFAMNSSTGVIERRDMIDYDTIGTTKFLMLKIVAMV